MTLTQPKPASHLSVTRMTFNEKGNPEKTGFPF